MLLKVIVSTLIGIAALFVGVITLKIWKGRQMKNNKIRYCIRHIKECKFIIESKLIVKQILYPLLKYKVLTTLLLLCPS